MTEQKKFTPTVWNSVKKKESLTWGRILGSGNLIELLRERGYLSDGKTYLEIGFGYNRFLTGMEKAVRIGNFVGIEISELWVAEAKKEFPQWTFRLGNVMKEEDLRDLGEFDYIFAWAVFQHQYPSFEGALRNLEGHLGKKGLLFFDIRIMGKPLLVPDGSAFNRIYTKKEVDKIIGRTNLEIVDSFFYSHEGVSKKNVFVLGRKGE